MKIFMRKIKIIFNNKEPFMGFVGSETMQVESDSTFKKLGANFHSLIAPNGLKSIQLAKKFSFPIVGTDVSEILNDLIATQ